ncbi:protein FAM111A-like [Echeneis naucrates]|uniref:Protein FAM111A-like n=1 Tax=Echeneis naucrates TaxID=173247 RepID=A0A665T4N0_ECHNA|nr:protein FAM111A-like [Echeneis naucrates]XP_029381750.1 protein FAM111A-like [Echeneis naucrates]XP_029381751.1 protein FAM111A-like [Echeneis naucrates]XP_029381752.1 protein FAM111A-like [Echeneis naucrates]XP_029381753.1 protein FAM111A-like [Echeneis naucrates]
MDPHILVQANSSVQSQGGEKARQVKRWFLFFLLLNGLSRGAGQGNPDTVTEGCSPQEGCSWERTTVEKDGQQEVEHQALLRTIKEVNPITCDRRCESAQLSPQAAKVRSTPSTPLASETPELKKKRMEESFSGFSSEEVIQKREHSAMRQSFGEAHRFMNVVKRGESVCKIILENAQQGTGFVLFDNFVLTNAHVFRGHIDEDDLQVDVKVLVVFNYDGTNHDTIYFTAKKTLIDFDDDEDYAVLELNPDGQRLFRKNETEKIKPPAGLLKYVGPVPASGKAYITGHPGGGMKVMDSTHIIKKEERVQAIDDHLRQYKDAPYTLHTIIEKLTAQGIKHVLPDGILAAQTVTYKTSMSHGSSGSPVFDANGRVFGLHSYIFHDNFGAQPQTVMAVAFHLDRIFMQFLTNLEKTDNYELLSRVEEEVEGNMYLKILMNLTVTHKYSYEANQPSSEDLEESED